MVRGITWYKIVKRWSSWLSSFSLWHLLMLYWKWLYCITLMEIITRLPIQSIKHIHPQVMMGKLWIIYMTHTSLIFGLSRSYAMIDGFKALEYIKHSSYRIHVYNFSFLNNWDFPLYHQWWNLLTSNKVFF